MSPRSRTFAGGVLVREVVDVTGFIPDVHSEQETCHFAVEVNDAAGMEHSLQDGSSIRTEPSVPHGEIFMKTRPENTEPAMLVGYLGRDGILYCSRDCSAARGQTDAVPVDQGEYQALIEGGTLDGGQLVCPVCGSEFPLDWPDDDRV